MNVTEGEGSHAATEQYFVKPMNCPFHIQIYKARRYSYRDLPLRWAELGTVYRYEKEGVRHGLLRVRGFTQDDAHIFCTPEQIEDEVRATVTLLCASCGALGSPTSPRISTRPEGGRTAGATEQATRSLESALKAESIDYQVDEGGGAFMGRRST